MLDADGAVEGFAADADVDGVFLVPVNDGGDLPILAELTGSAGTPRLPRLGGERDGGGHAGNSPTAGSPAGQPRSTLGSPGYWESDLTARMGQRQGADRRFTSSRPRCARRGCAPGGSGGGSRPDPA